MRTEIPTATCPNDAAANVVKMTPNSSHRIINERFMFMPFPDASRGSI